MSLIKARLSEAINRHVRSSIKGILEQLLPELSVNVTSLTSTLERGDGESNISFQITVTGHTVAKDIKPSPSPES